MTAPHRRGLVGLEPRGKPPITPMERTLIVLEDTTHAAAKQLRAACVNGIDHWWLETVCGERVVVTAFAPKGEHVTCMMCLMTC